MIAPLPLIAASGVTLCACGNDAAVPLPVVNVPLSSIAALPGMAAPASQSVTISVPSCKARGPWHLVTQGCP